MRLEYRSLIILLFLFITVILYLTKNFAKVNCILKYQVPEVLFDVCPEAKKISDPFRSSSSYNAGADTIFACTEGLAWLCLKCGGKRKQMIRILHKKTLSKEEDYFESIYAGLDKILVSNYSQVRSGDPIGVVFTKIGEPRQVNFEIKKSLKSIFFWGNPNKNYRNSMKWIRERWNK